jgi:hypothetical protein
MLARGVSQIGQTKPNILIMLALIRLTGWSPIRGRASASDRSAAARSRFRVAVAHDGRVQRPRNLVNRVAFGCMAIQGPAGPKLRPRRMEFGFRFESLLKTKGQIGFVS